jgi:RND family efflux transporter MFP subunit
MPTKTPLSRQIVLSLGIVAALGGVGFVLSRQSSSETHAAAPAVSTESVEVSGIGQKVVQVETSPVQAETQATDLHATGQILFSSDQTVKISPRLSGRVRQVFVRVGDHVTAGQTLALLDSIDAAAAQNTARQNDNKLRLASSTLERTERLYKLGTPDVTSAQANLDQAKARVEFTKSALERVQEQARIGGFTEKPVEDAQTAVVGAVSDLAQAQADQAQAQRDRDRKAKLVEIGIAAKSDLEAAENALEKARVTVKADQEKLALVRTALERERKAFQTNLYADQQIRSAQSDARQAQLQQEAAETALRLAKTTILRDLQQARSDYQAARADAENSHHVLTLLGQPGADGAVQIQAPISGVITDRQVSPGQVVDQSQMTPWQMFTLSNTSTVWVEADVYEKDISAIHSGQNLTITVAALPHQEFTGTVRHIAPALDKTTRAVKVRAEIANANGLLKDGMYADVRIRSGNGKSALAVPLEAILHDGDSDFVYVKQKDKYLRRQVTLGAQRDGRAIVEKGLAAGDMVVTHGALFLGNQNSGG